MAAGGDELYNVAEIMASADPSECSQAKAAAPLCLHTHPSLDTCCSLGGGLTWDPQLPVGFQLPAFPAIGRDKELSAEGGAAWHTASLPYTQSYVCLKTMPFRNYVQF